jgi:hypothetical protein
MALSPATLFIVSVGGWAWVSTEPVVIDLTCVARCRPGAGIFITGVAWTVRQSVSEK